MSKNPTYVDAFKKKLTELSKTSGREYKVVYNGFNDHLVDNRLSPYWFRPGEIIASAETEEGIVIFEISGKLESELIDSKGEGLFSFDEFLTPLDDVLSDDKDLKALIDGTHPSGNSLWINSGSIVSAFLQATDMEPVKMHNASVASAILDPAAIDKVLAAAKASASPEEQEIELPPEEFFPDNEKDEKEEAKGKRKAALEESMKNLESAGEDAAPKKTKVTTKKKSEDKMDKEVKAKEPEKVEAVTEEPAKKAKKEKVAKEPAKKTSSGGRCDLLPLDVLSDFLAARPGKDDDPFSLVRVFTETGDPESLIKAAKAFSSRNYDCDETALLELSVLMEEDAAVNGEGAWKDADDLKPFVNDGIRHILQFSRGDTDMSHDRGFMQAMLCGAWICKCAPEKNNYRQ